MAAPLELSDRFDHLFNEVRAERDRLQTERDDLQARLDAKPSQAEEYPAHDELLGECDRLRRERDALQDMLRSQESRLASISTLEADCADLQARLREQNLAVQRLSQSRDQLERSCAELEAQLQSYHAYEPPLAADGHPGARLLGPSPDGRDGVATRAVEQLRQELRKERRTREKLASELRELEMKLEKCLDEKFYLSGL